MSATEDVKELIENQLDAIEIEVASLRDALRRLDRNGTAAPTRRGGGRPDKAPTGSRASRPRAGASRQGKPKLRTRGAAPTARNLQQLLAEHDGLTTSVIAERAGIGREQALALLKELEDRGEVRRSGQRRGVRWHGITDEDRIRERAAELERLAKRS